MAPTIRDVAARAGVSSATGSLVLSGKTRGRVSPTTADRVRAAARELGYRNPRRARAGGPLGLVSLDVLSHSLVRDSLDAVRDAAKHRGLEVVAIDVPDESALPRGFERLGEVNVAGALIVTGAQRSISLPENLPGPVVLVEATSDRPDVDSVVPDDGVGQRAVLSELAAAGHHWVGWIGHEPPSPHEHGCLAVLREATAEFGWDDNPARVAQIDGAHVRDGFEAFERMFDVYPDVTAVVCGSDALALGVYLAAGERGIRIPADLSVVGFDNQPLISHALRPALTTVSSPRREIGQWAVARLADRIQHPTGLSPAQVTLPSRPVVRDSVAPPRARR
jgi:LacI family transcriptional regulator